MKLISLILNSFLHYTKRFQKKTEHENKTDRTRGKII